MADSDTNASIVDIEADKIRTPKKSYFTPGRVNLGIAGFMPLIMTLYFMAIVIYTYGFTNSDHNQDIIDLTNLINIAFAGRTENFATDTTAGAALYTAPPALFALARHCIKRHTKKDGYQEILENNKKSIN